MRFLADESCDAFVVRALRSAGHDVRAVVDVARGATDHTVLALATAEQHVLLTEDKDFGQLVFAGAPSTGVILIRFPPPARARLPRAVLDVVAARGDGLQRAFVSVTPAGSRVLQLR